MTTDRPPGLSPSSSTRRASARPFSLYARGGDGVVATPGARALRQAGLIACLIGVMIMSAGRFNPHVPPVFASIGLGVIVVGWGLLAFSAFRRGRSSRNPTPGTRHP